MGHLGHGAGHAQSMRILGTDDEHIAAARPQVLDCVRVVLHPADRPHPATFQIAAEVLDWKNKTGG